MFVDIVYDDVLKISQFHFLLLQSAPCIQYREFFHVFSTEKKKHFSQNVISMIKQLIINFCVLAMFFFLLKESFTFAQISSIDPDVNEKVFDDDKAFFSLSI